MAQDNSGAASAEWRTNWLLVVAATAGMSLAALSTSSFGVIMPSIEKDLGWSRAEISVGPMLISAMVILMGTFAGMAVDKLGPRIVAICASALLCATIAAMSTISEPWMWLGLWAMIGIGSSTMPVAWVTPISKAFSAGRGLALAVVLSGSGISSFLVPNIANYLTEHYGWRFAYQGLGALWAIVVIPLVIFFLREPKAAPAAASGASAAPQPVAAIGLTPREGFRSPAFYKLLFANFITVAASVALVLNLFPVLTSTGLTTASAAAIAGIVGVATIAGRVFSGWLMDRMSASVIVASAVAGMVVLPALLLAVPGSAAVATVAVALFGMLGGTTTPALAYLVSKHLGARSYGTFYATINIGSAIGIGVGPLLANVVYDRVKSYEPVMWASMPLLVFAALLYLWLGRYPDFDERPEGAEAA